MIQLFQEIWAIIVGLWNTGNRWIRWAIVISIVWPLAILQIALLGWQSMVSYIALIPLFIILLLFIAWLNPLVVVAVAVIPGGKRALRWLAGIIAVELMIGIYLSLVPIIKNPGFLPLLILVITAIAFIRISPIRTKWVKTILYISVVIITLAFFIPNTMKAVGEKSDNWDKEWAESIRKPKPLATREAVTVQIYPNYDFPDGVNQIKVPLIPPEQRLSRQAGGWVKAPAGARVRIDHDVPIVLENIDGRRMGVRPEQAAWFGVEPGNGLVRFYGEKDKFVTISIKRGFYK